MCSVFPEPCSWLIADATELVVTIIFDIEIILRFIIAFPDWRTFFGKTRNVCDLFLAVSTTIIQFPAIHNSGVYGWLTIFQILRVYRVILAVPITRNLLVMSLMDLANRVETSAEQCLQLAELDPFHLQFYVFGGHTRLSVDSRGHSDDRSEYWESV
jgi:Ion transport protein